MGTGARTQRAAPFVKGAGATFSWPLAHVLPDSRRRLGQVFPRRFIRCEFSADIRHEIGYLTVIEGILETRHVTKRVGSGGIDAVLDDVQQIVRRGFANTGVQ